MGHLVGKDLYRKLGRKVDGLSARAPWNDALYAILKELYTPEEAELAIRMPYGLSDLDTIERVTGYDRVVLQKYLESLSEKGLLLDIFAKDRYFYTLSPFVVGIFEFTMMRTRGELNAKEWARLFKDYMGENDAFFRANFAKGQSISPLRALPHQEAFEPDEYVEVLDYEKASFIVDEAKVCAVGICSCRHEKSHTGDKRCDIPLETCSSFGVSADYLIRHGMAKEVSKDEMRDNLEYILGVRGDVSEILDAMAEEDRRLRVAVQRVTRAMMNEDIEGVMAVIHEQSPLHSREAAAGLRAYFDAHVMVSDGMDITKVIKESARDVDVTMVETVGSSKQTDSLVFRRSGDTWKLYGPGDGS